MKMTLPQDPTARKQIPIYSGFVRYFPAAIAGAAAVSQMAMKQHKLPALGHDRTKSTDHTDCVPRHMMDVEDLIAAYDRGEKVDVNLILLEASSAVWRVSAWSQMLHERFGNAPMAPAAYIPPPPPSVVASEETLEIPAFLRPQRQV